jgi:D-alanine--poly(phosphoribitol) ligase subunit 2
MTVADRVLSTLSGIAETDEVMHDPDLRLFDEGVLDSLATVQLIVALEQEFGMHISPAALDREDWATPRKIVTYVQDRLGE